MQKDKPFSPSKPTHRLIKWLQVILPFFLGALLGLITGWSLSNKTSPRVYEIRQSGYKFINPLLECETISEQRTKELEHLKYDIIAFVNSKLSSKEADHISVYFRDLNNGPWFGIKENERFAPASLLKIPIMISWLKKSETNHEILKKMIKYENTIYYIPQDIEPKEAIKTGESYTIEDLIYRMIVYSDNEAKNILLLNIDQETQDKVYKDLGIDIPNVKTPHDFMSVKSYASFFRILYNASYLNKEMSELALNMLSQEDFADGLRAGIPKGTMIANKFGERAFNGIKQLHDCGIIYNNDHPYLLCIMTRGKDFKQLSNIIRDISRLVYTKINEQYNQ